MSAPDANGWLPIETALKDGTRVELWQPTNVPRYTGCPVHGIWVGLWRSDSGHPLEPTHWKHSSPPPVGAA